MTPNTTQRGFLLLGDISGHTSFVAATELEHAVVRFQILRRWKFGQLNGLVTVSDS